jgi:beta-galactosidase/beta-glucuronidase
MVRPRWQNLNGLWDYAVLPKERESAESFEGKILVPFAIESALSGVKRALPPHERLWYRRTFEIPADWTGGRVLLHFGAVDYEANVWVNGAFVGSHSGGYLPFTFDVTPFLRRREANELRVAVWDPSDAGMQQYGKQSLKPKTIWYTAVSGIWQTVWLEHVPERYIAGLRITPDVDAGEVRVQADLRGGWDDSKSDIVRVAVYDAGMLVAQGNQEAPGLEVRIPILNPKLWSPDSPHLYDLVVEMGDDRVGSYFGMRKFGLVRDASGHLRFALNDNPLFLYGPLDQGYFPDGLYTAPTDVAMLFDIEYIKRLGCNLIRKHVKVEPARWYYHCDRLGMIVWQDMPNGGKPVSYSATLLAMVAGMNRDDTRELGRFGRAEAANRERFLAELEGMVGTLCNAPCIAAWVPFNEGWGQFQAKQVAERLRELDPTRSVDHASGWFDRGGGDYQSRHIYGVRLKRKGKDKRAFVLSEFGGYSLKVAGHLWDEDRKFGYRFYDTAEALTDAYLLQLESELKPLVQKGLMAAIYTQTTDVEIEINGYLTYDRRVEKMPPERLRPAHQSLCALSG